MIIMGIPIPNIPGGPPPQPQRGPLTCTGSLLPWLVPCSYCRSECWSWTWSPWWSWRSAPGSQTCQAPLGAGLHGLCECSTAQRTHCTSYLPPPSPLGLWTGKEEGWLMMYTTTYNNNQMLSSIFLKLYLQNCIACNLQHRLFITVWSYSFSYLVHVWLEPCWYSLFFNFGPLVIFHYHLLTHIKNTSSMASHLSEFSENSLLNNAFNTKNIALSKNVLVVS